MSCWEQTPYSHSHPTKVMSHKQLTLWSHRRHFYTEKYLFCHFTHLQHKSDCFPLVQLCFFNMTLSLVFDTPTVSHNAVCSLPTHPVTCGSFLNIPQCAEPLSPEWMNSGVFPRRACRGDLQLRPQLTAQTDLHTHTCESCSRLQSGRTLNRASRHFSPSPLLSGPERESAELYAQHALRKPGKTSAPRGCPALWVSAGRKHDEHAAALKCGLF